MNPRYAPPGNNSAPPYANPSPPPAAPGYPNVPPPAAAPPSNAPASTASLPLPSPDLIDATGAFSQGALDREPQQVLAELTSALPDDSRRKVAGVPLTVVNDPKEVNAFAGCSKTGAPILGITGPLVRIAARGAEVRAYDEVFGTAKYREYTTGVANEVKANKTVTGPPRGFLPFPQSLDPRKLARQKQLFDEQLAFVLGHELAHHHRGHTGCANGASTRGGVDAEDIGRMLSNTIPFLNQPNEIQADQYGTWNLLDAGAHRSGGAWTEEGALMTLDFFSTLQSLGVETLLLGFLMTHPPPQLRLPIVQGTAQQWRNTGGKGPVAPFSIPLPWLPTVR